MKKLTKEEFLERCFKVHGNTYDYSKIEYKGTKEKVCIICPIHGEFWQSPEVHMKGRGCIKCRSHALKKTKEKFVEQAKQIHGNKYDYSKVEYVNDSTKVCIICPTHGEFWQTPRVHLNGSGCPKCCGKYKTNEEFIEESKKIHGNKYDYSKVNYKKALIPVCIVCPEHGEFWQTPNNHLRSKGCPKCAGNIQMTTDDFIKKAKEIHGNKYDYSKVNYVNTHKHVIIICPEHGEFLQTPAMHLEGQGCPNCHLLRKKFKFNLLKEFESEYELRAFLENNDINILQIILRNIESKYEPIKKDIEKVLNNPNDNNPIKTLEEKYNGTNEDENSEIEEDNIDLDDDNEVKQSLSKSNNNSQCIDIVVKNTEKELKIINKIEHTLTPEERQYIMDKFLNDKMREYIAQKEY